MNELQVFENSEFGKLGVLTINGKPHFPATECAKLLGYEKPHNAIAQHCRYSLKQGVPHPQNPDRTIEMNFIPEGDLYRLITHSKLPAAERFERWVFDEVLPSIRRHGAYLTDEKVEQILSDPDTLIRLATDLKTERTKRKALEITAAQQGQLIAELQPKATYYDLILQNKSLVPVSVISKDYGMSARAFNELLHELGVQYKVGSCWLLYQGYAQRGYTQSKTEIVPNGASVMFTCWTQTGRLFLYELLKRHGRLPLIEINTDMMEEGYYHG
ncbi:phage antirepressor KilAC domain-containing protein [Eubacteriales bacterium OttesenSCG-928-N13]|nr:phage antirepressor KilAC domain-containing protein [Eubacteriales bacterium OttesenSCG-928-N13]